MAYGTLSTLDTLASIRRACRLRRGPRLGLDLSRARFAQRPVQEMLGTLVERTTDARRSYGTGDVKVMDEMDQWGQSDAQKISAAVTVDFPLRRYGNSLQWTRQWMISNTVAQLAAEVAAIMDADRSNLIKQVKRAVYTPTNARSSTSSACRPTCRCRQGVRQQRRLGLPGRAERRGVRHLAHHYLANATLTARR
jgi:hypothetical protein